MTTARSFNPIDDAYLTVTHAPDCPYSSSDPVRWVCDSRDEVHWFSWDPPPATSDQCPIVYHDNNYEGRCVGTLTMPECHCDDPERTRRA